MATGLAISSTQARQIQPSLRTILIIDHDYHTAAEAAQWRSPVIISSKNFFDGTGTCRIAQLAAIGNTTYRSKSIPVADTDSLENGCISLSERERQLLECYVLGLNNNEAAQRIRLSPLTCKTYSRNLLTKLRVNNRQMASLGSKTRLNENFPRQLVSTCRDQCPSADQ